MKIERTWRIKRTRMISFIRVPSLPEQEPAFLKKCKIFRRPGRMGEGCGIIILGRCRASVR